MNTAGSPALGAVAGGVINSVGDPATPTVTVPDAWPDVGVVDGVPVAGGVAGAVAPTLAVTVADVEVVRTVCAVPVLSVVASDVLSTPPVVENDTCADTNAFPFTSNTTALTVDEPPSAGTSVGFALTMTLPTAAVPTRIFSAPLAPTLAPPDIAVMVAVPDATPAANVAVA